MQWQLSKIKAELNYILSDGNEAYLKTIQQVADNFIALMKPKAMDSGNQKNIALLYKVQFGELCAALSSNGCQDPEDMTVLNFYAALNYFENKKKSTQPTP